MRSNQEKVTEMAETALEHHPLQGVTLDDFMTGFLAALAKRGIDRVSIRGTSFYRAVTQAFDQFEAAAGKEGLRVDFFITLNRVHGDSADVREGITKAVQRDLISLDNPVYLDMRLKIGPAEADSYLESLPGEVDLYMGAAEKFIAAYATD